MGIPEAIKVSIEKCEGRGRAQVALQQHPLDRRLRQYNQLEGARVERGSSLGARALRGQCPCARRPRWIPMERGSTVEQGSGIQRSGGNQN